MARETIILILEEIPSNASDGVASAPSCAGLRTFGESRAWKWGWSCLSGLSRWAWALSTARLPITQPGFISSTVIRKWTSTAHFCKLGESAHLKRNRQSCFFKKSIHIFMYKLLIPHCGGTLWQTNMLKWVTKRVKGSIQTAMVCLKFLWFKGLCLSILFLLYSSLSRDFFTSSSTTCQTEQCWMYSRVNRISTCLAIAPSQEKALEELTACAKSGTIQYWKYSLLVASRPPAHNKPTLRLKKYWGMTHSVEKKHLSQCVWEQAPS